MEPTNQTGTDGRPQDGESPINRDFVQALLEHAWLVVSILVVAAAVGYWIGAHTPVAYQSRAVLFMDFAEQKVLAIEEVDKRERGGSVDLLNTIANNVKSSTILKRVVTSRNLAKHPYFTRGTNTPTEQQVIGAINGAVDARLRRFTRLIDVSAEAGDPVVAQLLAQSVAEEYIKQSAEDRTGVGQNAGQFLMAEEGRVRERLNKAERALQEYRQTNNISLQENRDILTSEFKTLAQKCTEAKDERRLLELEWNLARQVGDKLEDLLKLPLVMRAPEVVTLKEKVQTQETLVNNLLLRYKEKHPAMIQARSELASLQKLFKDEVRNAPPRIQRQLEAAVEKEKSLEQALKEQEKTLFVLDSQRAQFDAYQREVTADRRLYDTIVQRLREIDVTGGMKQTNVKIVEPAYLPGGPVRPNKRMILFQALAIGLVFSVGLVWLIQQMDTTIKSVDHAERLLGLPVLGAVPKNKLVKDGKTRLFMSDDPESLCAEAFRSLRASLGLLGREEERRVILFTSAVPSEGKSFCCVNYAVAHAQQGKRTLVIDFDLRKPSLSETFGVKSGLPGVTDVMLGKETLDKCVQTTRFDNLFLLAAGGVVPNPAELLSGPWARKLIQEAVGKFDQVVLDNAPVNAVSDTLLIVKEAQTVCLVTHARKTSARVVLRALEMLRRAGVKPSGVIINFLPQNSGSGYYYYYSGSKYYGNKGVYGAKSSKN
ncbi:MAG: polysaccharide biosynthesis tyrosine autokinase [Limisphaerales bacterium]